MWLPNHCQARPSPLNWRQLGPRLKPSRFFSHTPLARRDSSALPGGAAIGHDINYRSVLTAVRTVLGREGVRGLYRGVDAMALGAGPAHAFYFATYEARRRAPMHH